MPTNTKNIMKIDGVTISHDHPTYFIADIAANHDGSLQKAKDLIFLAAESGANAAKFQHFQANTIVSDLGFRNLNISGSHQDQWKSSVYDVYRAASINLEWTASLKETCDKAGISFFTSPYSIELVDYINEYVPAFKIGSGDITWHEIIRHIAGKQKPYILATGASNILEVQDAVDIALSINSQFALLQCNTNYTASLENFKYINLNVLRTYQSMYPNLILGLSDHTPGHASVLGAIALGARIIEKHFTDDKLKEGPDHQFSMCPADWLEMVARSRELENSLGTGIKKIEGNELVAAIVQRRSLHLNKSIKAGSIITPADLCALRPCPTDGIPPYKLDQINNATLLIDKIEGDCLKWTDIKLP